MSEYFEACYSFEHTGSSLHLEILNTTNFDQALDFLKKKTPYDILGVCLYNFYIIHYKLETQISKIEMRYYIVGVDDKDFNWNDENMHSFCNGKVMRYKNIDPLILKDPIQPNQDFIKLGEINIIDI